MFTTLIESRAARQRHTGGTAVSVLFHVVLASAALIVTYHANAAYAKPHEEKVSFVTVRKDVPPPKEVPPPVAQVVEPPPPKGFQILIAPIAIPDVIPDIDLSNAVTNPDNYRGIGAPGGVADGVPGGKARPVQSDVVYPEFLVEKQVTLADGNTPPVYPPSLRAGNMEGSVLVTFVVDTTGRADLATVVVIRSTHDLFTAAVKQRLASMKFIPAEIGGHKVKQLVQMPFVFTLNK